jgi:hypothetical protein
MSICFGWLSVLCHPSSIENGKEVTVPRQTDDIVDVNKSCGQCAWWESFHQPSGTGGCTQCGIQKDVTSLCSCLSDRFDILLFKQKEAIMPDSEKICGKCFHWQNKNTASETIGVCSMCSFSGETGFDHKCSCFHQETGLPQFKSYTTPKKPPKDGDIELKVRVAVQNPLFAAFQGWAATSGVDTGDHPEDWYDWWVCFYSGALEMRDRVVDLLKGA